MKSFFTHLTTVILYCSISVFSGIHVHAEKVWNDNILIKSSFHYKMDINTQHIWSPRTRQLNAIINSAQSGHSAFFMPVCPSNISVNAGPGECGQIVNFDFGLIPVALQPAPPITHNANTVAADATVYCPAGVTKYSRTFLHAGPTDLNINFIDIGVYQAIGNPIVTVNIYLGNVLLGSNTSVVPGPLNSAVFPFPIAGVKIPAGANFRVEIITPPPFVNIFKIGRNAGGHIGAFQEAVITSSSCLNFMVEGIAGADAVLFSVRGTPDSHKIVKLPNPGNLPNNPYNSGDFFPIGVHYMTYTVTDAAGNVLLTCIPPFTITVNGFANAVTSLACKGMVNVSLDSKCEATLRAEQLLEGDNYGCFNDYIVNVTALNGLSLGNKVGKLQIGQKLNYRITGPNNNSCWGEVLVEDKFGPEMICEDIYTTCSSPLTPGSNVSARVGVPAAIVNNTISDGAANSRTYNIPVQGLANSILNDLNVFIDVSHTRVSDLAATITSPDGVTATLFMPPVVPSCNGDDMVVTFDDEAVNTYNTFVNTCEPTTPTLAGIFRPRDVLSIFDGKPLNGNWTVTIYDLAAGEGGTVNHIDLIFTQTGAKVGFPTPNNVTWSHVNDNIYLVNGIDNCSQATLSYVDTVVEEDCGSIYAKVIRRCWSGTDALSNIGPGCCQLIYVYRNGLSTLQFPPNYDGIQEPALSCLDFGSEVPGTDVTGLPYGDLCYNVQILEPIDVRIDLCNNTYKLIRTHKVLDWCSGQVIVHNQIIKVADDYGPELECPDDVTISTDYNDCWATYSPPLPIIIEECSDTLKYTLAYYPGVHGEHYYGYEYDLDYITTNIDQTTGTIYGLPIGDSWVKWIVEDQCGNLSYCYFMVTVVDQVKPIAVCDQITKVSIGGTGKSIVYALTFDDGSHDNCGIDTYEVLRMDNGVPCSTTGGNLWGPSVTFCCADIGNTIMVSLRVTDLSGNSNTCMVEVLVEDKLPPFITRCPPDITLSCQTDYEDLSITGEPDAVDNCKIEDIKYQDNKHINQCGVGYVTRTWTVRDHQDFRHSCVQVITLIDYDPFTKADIIWPLNYETKKCHSLLDPSALPDGFNYPKVADDNCSLVAYHYKDQIFKFVDGACEKIIRTWTVIDWCTYDEIYPEYGVGWYEHIQIIKLHNDISPIFELETPCVDRVFQTYGVCEGEVEFEMSAVDDCPEDNTNLVWKYDLDIFNDGVNIITVRNSKIFKRILPNGVHKITWTVEDRCGNRTVCTHLITVRDGKNPTPYCITSITTAVMNSDGTIAIWAKDYDLGSFDNCTHKSNLWFTFFGAKPVASKLDITHYFKGNGQDATLAEYSAGLAQIWYPLSKSSGILFDCDDIPDGKSQEISVEMWITDQDFNQDYCTVKLVLQDNADVCPDQNGNMVSILGKVVTTDNKPMKDVKVRMNSDAPEQNKLITSDLTGGYAFTQLPKQYNYTLTPEYNLNIMNGVSTLDLVYIQRHILGLAALPGPHHIIAADVDNNQKVTAADLVALRKVILGVSTEFPNNQKSWRFVNNTQAFQNPLIPFPFVEQYVYNTLTTNKVNQNFVAIKIGDVNNSVIFNANEVQVESRSKNILTFEVPEIDASINEQIALPIYASDFNEIFGYQFTMHFDASSVEFISIESGALEISEAHFGTNRREQGILTTSWHSETASTVSSDQALFTLIFKSKKSFTTSDLIEISSEITPAVAFDGLNSVMNIRLQSRVNPSTDQFELYQNTPNPFNEQTSIGFNLPESANVQLKIFDMNGKMIRSIQNYFTKGEHFIQIRNSEIGSSGVYYYQLESGKYTAARKMIIIE